MVLCAENKINLKELGTLCEQKRITNNGPYPRMKF